jgi:hypothetical protein
MLKNIMDKYDIIYNIFTVEPPGHPARGRGFLDGITYLYIRTIIKAADAEYAKRKFNSLVCNKAIGIYTFEIAK